MNEQTRDRLVTAFIGVITVAGAIAVTLRIGSLEPTFWASGFVLAGVTTGLLVLLVGAVVWALFRHQLANLLFGPWNTRDHLGTTPPDLQKLPPRSRFPYWYESPRWTIPVAGACLLLALFLGNLTGILSRSVAFTTMAVLAFGSLVVGLAVGESEEEGRRADTPLVMFGTWALLYTWTTGLLFPILAAASWPALLGGTGIVLMRDYPIRWIPIGFCVVVILNLVVLFGYFRG